VPQGIPGLPPENLEDFPKAGSRACKDSFSSATDTDRQKTMKPPLVRALVLSFLVLAVAAGCRVKVGESPAIETSAFTAEEEAAALQSVRSFMKELDAEQGDTWSHLSQGLKGSLMKPVWSATLTGLNTAFGKKLERGGAKFAFTEKLPDAPPGRYFICDISSKFERGDVTERVVLVHEDGQWKIAGYFRTKSISLQGDSKNPKSPGPKSS
jgi:hypothetical protein